MAEIIRMPLMSDTMTEGVIVSWHKKVGDTVQSGDLMAEVETDKATMELESYWEGTLLHIGPKEGETIPVNAVLAIVGEKGEEFADLLAEAESSAATSQQPAEEAKPEAPAAASSTQVAPAPPAKPAAPATPASNGRVKASPLAKRMAADLGLDLAGIPGSGDDGRIVRRDVEAAAQQPASAPTQVQLPEIHATESYEEVALSQMRKTIARRLSESKFGAPHFYLNTEINMGQAKAARARMNEVAPVKISFNDMIIKAAALALRQHPDVNSSWLGDKIRKNHHVNVGMAVAIEDGLVVPVIRFADTKTLSHISVEAKTLAGKARDRKLQPEEFSGNTFTISNLGMFDITEFTAIINPPDSCIMAVGSIREIPAVVDGAVVPASMMKVTLSCDHRAVDGAMGAQFLQTFKGLLEDPVRMLI